MNRPVDQEVALLRVTLGLAQVALSADIDHALEVFAVALPEAARVLGVDCAFVDVIDIENDGLVNVAWWTDTEVEPDHTTNIGTIPLGNVIEWIDMIRTQSRVIRSDTSLDPEFLAAKAVFGNLETATLNIGLFANGVLLGILGLGMLNGPREWSDKEIELAGLAADVITSVLERRRVGDELARSERHFRLLAESALEMVCLTDRQGSITYATPSTYELLGRSADEVLGCRFESFAQPGQDVQADHARDQLLATGRCRLELQVRLASGESKWVQTHTRTIVDADTGELEGFRIAAQDISELKALQERLTQLAARDVLTGLFNRRELSVRLTRFLERGDESIALLLLDLDGFKAVNDRYGHHAGDEVLVAIAQRLLAVVRPGDLVARLGGDEFVVMCRNASSAEASALADRVVRVINEPVAGPSGITLQVSASVGVATAPIGWPGTANQLLINADSAMYRAKAAAGGQVRVA
jgi:diguanylate cyclase (GGDEF)-like protein/PAS domain S-box-containing protein